MVCGDNSVRCRLLPLNETDDSADSADGCTILRLYDNRQDHDVLRDRRTGDGDRVGLGRDTIFGGDNNRDDVHPNRERDRA